MLLETWANHGLVDAFRQMDRLENQMRHVFGGRSWTDAHGYPEFNIYTADDTVMLETFLPGADPDKLDISLAGDTLTIKGEHLEEEGNVRYFRRERSKGAFSRTVTLPFRAGEEDVKAEYSNGVLNIRVKFPEAEKPKRIRIESK